MAASASTADRDAAKSPGELSLGPRGRSLAWLAGGVLAAALALETVLENGTLAGAVMSAGTWTRLFGSRVDPQGGFADLPLLACVVPPALMAAFAWLANRRDPLPAARTLGLAGLACGMWLACYLVISVRAGKRIDTGLTPLLRQAMLIVSGLVAPLAASYLAVWLATLLRPWLAGPRDVSRRTMGFALLAVVGLFAASSLAMNAGLWANLRVPHGDSAMYEEHLWNVLHGKGFRSYLDQGLFLGEHIQVIHLLLLPLYLLAPHHLTLEVCETAALAAAALLVVKIARRHGASRRAVVMLAAATLLYPPLQYLDIAIDTKTFRPITFGVPLLLWAIDALERRRRRQLVAAAFLTLACKEDFALVLAPLGLWRAVFPNAAVPSEVASDAAATKRERLVGLSLAVASTAYLFLAVTVLIPAFRAGEQTHYAADYYPGLGNSTGEIVATCLLRPWVPAGLLLSASGVLYATYTLLPLGGVPLLSPSRAAVAAPALAITILNKFTAELPQPVHHFHAPVVPVLLWALATAPTTSLPFARLRPSRETCAALALAFALAMGLLVDDGPNSLRFWDAGRHAYWRRLYVPDARATAWREVDRLIPPDARVASEDYPRARLTHRLRNYDYGHRFRRAVAGYEDRVPGDTEYIVLDRTGPYASGQPLSQTRELLRDPDRWEVILDGPFTVLRRRDLFLPSGQLRLETTEPSEDDEPNDDAPNDDAT